MNNKIVKILIALIVVALVIFGFMVLQKKSSTVEQGLVQESKITTNYINEEFGFSLTVPDYYTIEAEESEYGTVYFKRATVMPEWIKAGANIASVFTISPVLLTDFAKLKNDCANDKSEYGLGPVCFPFQPNVVGHKVLGQNDKYAFIFVRTDRSSDYPNDFTPDYFEEAEEIVKTFQTFNLN